MIKKIVMQQYKGEGKGYDVLHPETDSSMITDFEEASKDVLVVQMEINTSDNNDVVSCDHSINDIYNAYTKNHCVIAKVKDNRSQKTPVSVDNYIAPLFMAKQDDETIGGTTYHTNNITFNIFKDNVALRFLGTCTFNDESATEDIQDIWSWNLSSNIYEDKANMTQEITASSKAHQYPSAAAVYSAINNIYDGTIMTDITKRVDGDNTICEYTITDKNPHYAFISGITTSVCTIVPTMIDDNFNEHRILIHNNGLNTLGAQILPSGLLPFGGATTAYSIPAAGMVEIVFRRVAPVLLLVYYNFVDAH